MTTEEKLNALPNEREGDKFVKDTWENFFEVERERARHAYISQNLFEALAKQVSDAYETGRDAALDDALKIAHEALEKIVLQDLKTHPKTTLKSFAKRHGWLSDED